MVTYGDEGLLRCVAAGLWCVRWPSFLVNDKQFPDPFPIEGAGGQGPPVNVALFLASRIDSICTSSQKQDRFMSELALKLGELLNLEQSRVSLQKVLRLSRALIQPY
jgi:hypothetical protein